MKTFRPTFQKLSIFMVFIISITGCSLTETLPERFASVNEAYPSSQLQNIPEGMPVASFKKVHLPAPYEDVFRAFEVGLTQALLNIESSSHDNGVILATTDERGEKVVRYFLSTHIIEAGPESTDVYITAKQQDECLLESVGVATVLSAGLVTKSALELNKDCRMRSQPHWSEEASDKLSKVVVFARNNLIAAGAM